MFAGHVGAGLALARAARGVNPAAIVFAALLADVVLWVLVLAGVEAVTIPADFARTHQPHFDFPWSHGLAASIGWSLVAALIAAAIARRASRIALALWIGVAVMSHWLLDALVHRPELPLVGEGSARVGLALWDTLPLALGIESAILIVGLWVFVRGAAISTPKKVALSVLAILILAMTIAGMTIAPPPPSIAAMASIDPTVTRISRSGS